MKKPLFIKIFFFSSVLAVLAAVTINSMAKPLVLPDLAVSDIKLLPRITDDDGYELYPVQVTYRNDGNKRAYLSFAKETYDPPQLIKKTDDDGKVYFESAEAIQYDVPGLPVTYLDPGQDYVRTSYISPIKSGRVMVTAKIDSGNNVYEIDGKNNTKSQRFFVRPVAVNNDIRKAYSSEFPEFCGNLSGGDGVYSGCLGDTITHTPSGVEMTVADYNSRFATLSLKNAEKPSFVADKGAFREVLSDDGKILEIKYSKNDTHNGVFLEIKTKPEPLEDPSVCEDITEDEVYYNEQYYDADDILDEDGTYSLCSEHTVIHAPTGMDLTVHFYNHDQMIFSSNTLDSKYITLNKMEPGVLLLPSGYEMTFRYMGVSEDKKASLRISSLEPVTCGDVSGSGGRYAICEDDTISDTVSGTDFKMVSHVSDYDGDRVYFEVQEDSMIGLFRADEGVKNTFFAENGYEVTFEYIGGAKEHGYYFDVSSQYSRSLMSCGDDSGVDDTYVVCTGDTVTHTPSGIMMTIESYDEDYIDLSFKGMIGVTSLSLPKNEPYTYTYVSDKEHEVVFEYLEYVETEGAFVKISSDIETPFDMFEDTGTTSGGEEPQEEDSGFLELIEEFEENEEGGSEEVQSVPAEEETPEEEEDVQELEGLEGFTKPE